jgi:hypothetical protein
MFCNDAMEAKAGGGKTACDCARCFGNPLAKLLAQRQIYDHHRQFGLPSKDQRAAVIGRLKRERAERQAQVLQEVDAAGLQEEEIDVGGLYHLNRRFSDVSLAHGEDREDTPPSKRQREQGSAGGGFEVPYPSGADLTAESTPFTDFFSNWEQGHDEGASGSEKEHHRKAGFHDDVNHQAGDEQESCDGTKNLEQDSEKEPSTSDRGSENDEFEAYEAAPPPVGFIFEEGKLPTDAPISRALFVVALDWRNDRPHWTQVGRREATYLPAGL